jgi:hypothetical protein
VTTETTAPPTEPPSTPTPTDDPFEPKVPVGNEISTATPPPEPSPEVSTAPLLNVDDGASKPITTDTEKIDNSVYPAEIVEPDTDDGSAIVNPILAAIALLLPLGITLVIAKKYGKPTKTQLQLMIAGVVFGAGAIIYALLTGGFAVVTDVVFNEGSMLYAVLLGLSAVVSMCELAATHVAPKEVREN